MNRGIHIALFASLACISIPADAAIFAYSADLSGAQESPPVPTTGTGFTSVVYDDALHTLRVVATFSGLIGTTTASHIHIRPNLAALNGGVATQVPSFAGFPLGVTSGSFDNTFDLTMLSSWNPSFVTANGGSLATAEAALSDGLRNNRAYLNIHTSFRGGGEIRGDLAAVPEPATWAMMMLGFGLVGGLMRRRPAQSARLQIA